MTRNNSQRGLTLIETLVALAIMGLTTAAILVLIGQNTRFMISAEERAYASIAVDNLMVESLALNASIEIGEETGPVSVGGREWSYLRRIEQSGVDGLLVIEIDIRNSDNGQVLASATSLRREP